MRIQKVIIEGFRGYQHKIELTFNNLNVIVGVNDIGKSTILDALDLFFNEKDANTKLTNEDLNRKSKEIRIGVVFSDFKDEIIIDTTFPTSLANEFLLNGEGFLEIHKIYGATGFKRAVLVCNYPDDQDMKGILGLDMDELKNLANEIGISKDNYNASIKASIRSAIRDHKRERFSFSIQDVEIAKKDEKAKASDAKEIWSKLQNYLPVFALFQADRKNQENDSEVQKPMNAAIKSILQDASLQKQLYDIKKQVQEATETIANLTLEKLGEINDQLAKQLNPVFESPKWEAAFKFNLYSDDGVSLDKRGSGVRRLFLISFFMAQAEKRKKEKQVSNVIYALEEPETSQHPKHQHKLIESLIALSKIDNTQIILTTHSPSIASLLPTDSINVIHKEADGKKKIERGDDVLKLVTEELGIYSNFSFTKDISKVRLAICIEGHSDIEFLLNINKNILEFKKIIDLESDEIVLLPMGGSSLQFWVNNDYLSKFNIKQFHIYDSDIGSSEPNKYKKYLEKINKKGAGYIAVETTYRAMESYVSPSIIKEKYSVHIPFDGNWNKLDVAEYIAKYVHSISESPHAWEDLSDDKRKDKVSNIKKAMYSKLSPLILDDTLKEINAFDEIKGWHIQMAGLLA